MNAGRDPVLIQRLAVFAFTPFDTVVGLGSRLQASDNLAVTSANNFSGTRGYYLDTTHRHVFRRIYTDPFL